MTDIFLDTNILLYAISTSAGEARKSEIARNILQTLEWAWSAQVAAEFIRASCSSRQTAPLSFREAQRWIELWLAFPMAVIDGPLVIGALDDAQRFQISYFDAQILAAAKRLRCSKVLSEDLNHGQDYGGVQVINPFR